MPHCSRGSDNDLHPVLVDEPDLLVTKHVSSAFHGVLRDERPGARVTAVNFEPEFGRVVSTREAIDELELRRVA